MNLFCFLFILDVLIVICKLCSYIDNYEKEENVLNNCYK